MKIEGVKLSEGLKHGDDDNGDHNVVKKQGYAWKWPTLERSFKSMEDILNLIELSNTPQTPSPSTPSPSSMGKQKKHNEIKDQMSRMKKKKRPGSILKHAAPDHARKSMSFKQKKAASNALNSPREVKSSIMIRAEEVQSSLGTEFPSFVKVMAKSHVSYCFWMRLPVPFCKSHLPKTDAIIILENESGEQFELKFIADKQGLSAGWRKFSILHKLLVGDVLVFQLTKANKFKVHIIRANDFAELDGALGLLNLDAHTKQNDADDRGTLALKNKKRKRSKSLPLAMVQKENKETGLVKSLSRLVWPVEQSENDSEVIGSEVLVGSKLSGSSVAFGDIKSFEDFKITVNRFHIDSELPEHIWTKYYELCCSKSSFLHANLLQGLNRTLVTGIIFETVDIADAMRGCKLTASLDEFANWEKTLKSFELVGMNVGFLRARLRRLQTLAFASATFDVDSETLKSKAESYKLKFQEEVDTPW